MASSKDIPFPLGAKVVGVANLVLSLYLLTVGVAIAVFFFFFAGEYCSGINNGLLCGTVAFGGYGGIGIGVFGLIFFIVSVMLIVGVNMDRPNLMVPFIIWMVLSLLAILGVGIYMAINSGIIKLIIIIVSIIVGLIIPVYFLGVVAKHSVQLRKSSHLQSKGTPVVPFQQPQIGFVAFHAPPQSMMHMQHHQMNQLPIPQGSEPPSPLFTPRSNTSHPASAPVVE